MQWREVSWWVCRIHHASAASALPILSAPNYVVVTERDYEAFGHRPYGLVELLPATMDELANRTGLLGANYPLGPFWHPNDGATQWGESGSAVGAVL